MARTIVGSAVVVREKYYWPDLQLNIWTIIMLATAGTILGISANFMIIQSQMQRDTPWIFPYGVTVGALTMVVIFIELLLIAQRRLLPGIMMLLSFILIVLFITGIIGTSIQLFAGPNVNNLCNAFVNNQRQHGASLNTLGWLEQNSICQSWSALFAFWIIGSVFLVWMMVMASQVNQNQYD
ncbi:uncharacterized protein BDR25DRAFT_75036 [Lindgomyces ingoldianus]|uniref:Uncharacterized protein n=1 Tax=Lindgomyces ingoldianus TaxID=673940 RepID=A0ACB6QIG0_9PLEO|nr:uncharacterized protein BDR25DRAFT_75036 [Lindgomyces ingoldianus]KAF2466783.1 hypothetical protein BDR25DRAFT_75036 [Lindgomyces ingoldianus]